ncbi:hypothetical protein [Synechococcus sp. NOUM97013]|uniref:hypothetical protein n=1 Tax=Synechococcus sp. NOUM97013 TaxID=1442555 RepID=UPI0016457A4F|nr:hypothetical protein [Synechococcus sp. NOUM97013]QNI72357.1 N-acetylmuramoyl-L-alanine amidase [Synechococcus sp. NOUM97013]
MVRIKSGIDHHGRTWALAADLPERYDFPHAWEVSRQSILIGALDLAPTYRDDALHASIGWALVELALQTGNAPVILTGTLRQGGDGDRS